MCSFLLFSFFPFLLFNFITQQISAKMCERKKSFMKIIQKKIQKIFALKKNFFFSKI